MKTRETTTEGLKGVIEEMKRLSETYSLSITLSGWTESDSISLQSTGIVVDFLDETPNSLSVQKHLTVVDEFEKLLVTSTDTWWFTAEIPDAVTTTEIDEDINGDMYDYEITSDFEISDHNSGNYELSVWLVTTPTTGMKSKIDDHFSVTIEKGKTTFHCGTDMYTNNPGLTQQLNILFDMEVMSKGVKWADKRVEDAYKMLQTDIRILRKEIETHLSKAPFTTHGITLGYFYNQRQKDHYGLTISSVLHVKDQPHKMTNVRPKTMNTPTQHDMYRNLGAPYGRIERIPVNIPVNTKSGYQGDLIIFPAFEEHIQEKEEQFGVTINVTKPTIVHKTVQNGTYHYFLDKNDNVVATIEGVTFKPDVDTVELVNVVLRKLA